MGSRAPEGPHFNQSIVWEEKLVYNKAINLTTLQSIRQCIEYYNVYILVLVLKHTNYIVYD